MPASAHSLRIALLTYRGNPHSGGQGVYVRYLSRSLRELGHQVEVFSGQPYPNLYPGTPFTKVPSLDLYRPEDPFRTPRPSEFRDITDVIEYLTMITAAFPEPLTFSIRAGKLLRERLHEFDVVHDNQSLGYGLMSLLRRGLPVVGTIHHPITVDRRLSLSQARSPLRQVTLRRWYSFTRMQKRVARQLTRVIAPSISAKADTVREFGVKAERVGVVHNGVDADLFRPLAEIDRGPGRIVTISSADLPQKGLNYLIEALAKVRTEVEAKLIVVGKGGESKIARRTVERLGIEDVVRFERIVEPLRLVELYASAEVAVVPSIYEGFSLPAVEAMSCAVPLVATTGGALPEVVGEDETTGLLVPPRDSSALAQAILRLLKDASLREGIGRAGREKVLHRFTWRSTAEATVDEFRKVLG